MWRSNSSGYSLIEIVVVLGIVSLMGIGTTALLSSMIKLNQKSKAKASLILLKEQIIQNIRDESAWTNTLNAGSNTAKLGCLRDTNLVGCVDGASIVNPDIMDRANNMFYQASSATAGWSIDGEPCNAWNGGGNNDCPIRFNMTMTFECGTRNSPCRRPDIMVDATLAFAFSDDTSIGSEMVLSDFNFSFLKKVGVALEPSIVIFQDLYPGPPSTCATDPANFCGGPCLPGDWRRRKINKIAKDQGGNVVNIGARWFRLEPGIYDCNITAHAFEATDGFKVRLIRIAGGAGGPWEIGGGFSGSGTTTVTEGSVHLELPSATQFAVEHYCGPATAVSDYNMGIPAQTYGASPIGIGRNVHTMVECTREN